MAFKHIFTALLLFGFLSCETNDKQLPETNTYADVQIAGAMKNVMWKGELEGVIQLDTIADKVGLYGLGPLSYLQGELLINNGKAFVSRVTSDSTMTVEKTLNVSAPFLVYGNVRDWEATKLPENIKTIPDLEAFIDQKTRKQKRPFACKLEGRINHAIIHIQNLPPGTIVSSPKEAHQGQTNYPLENEEVEIVGFFSTKHQGIFTHHDTFLHLHLITRDQSKMGHLDDVEFGEMMLYLPKK